jgi:hypothetical protein
MKLFRKSGTLENCGSRKRVTVSDRRMSRHATVAWRKRNLTRNIRIQESHESPKEFAAPGMRKNPEGNDDIRHRDVKELPHLRKERTTNGTEGGALDNDLIWEMEERSG